MKGSRFFVVASLLAISSGAYAQFTNASSGSSMSSSGIDGWTGVWAEYNPIKLGSDNEDISLSGFSAGGSRTFSITQDIPLLVETGVGVQYASGSKTISMEDYYGDKVDVKTELDIFSAKVPVNLLFGFEIPNSNITVFPFVGVTLRFNISGNMKLSDDWGSIKMKVFDEDDVKEKMATIGRNGNAFERFQVCWQIGAKACVGGNFIVGVSYGKDMMEISKGNKIQTTSISVGYTF